MAGGLEVSDEVLRLVYFDGKKWQMAAIRMQPGIMEHGKIKDGDAFVAALTALRGKIADLGAKNKKKMNVVISMSSVKVYSQTFSLPFVQGQELDNAVQLNMQMLSPVDIAQMYASSEILKRDEEGVKIEILASFIDRKIVDDVIAALFRASFVVVGVESRPLAMMRILREKGAGIDIEKTYLVVNIDNSGLDFLIAREGKLYFEYANQWPEIADDKGQISAARFEDTLTSSLRQVVNFHDQHWKEPLAAIIVSAAAFEDQAEVAIKRGSALPIIRLSLYMGQPVSSEWLVALGCSLRGMGSQTEKEINLLGEGAQDAFKKDEFIHFLNLWRVVVPVALSLLIVTYALASGFLANTQRSIESQSDFTLATAQVNEITALTASSTEFNQMVSLLQVLESGQKPKYLVLNRILGLAATSSVELNHIVFQSLDAPIYTGGSAQDENNILNFKKAIESDPSFANVSLPLTSIQGAVGTGFTFTMTFNLSPSGLQ